MRTYCIAQGTLFSIEMRRKSKKKKREDMCICIADSLCSTVEHYIKYNFVKQLNSNKIFFKDKIEEPHSIIEV